ncbi:MAG: hypothetical protein ABSD03_11045 [Vulcanimicrobiaceae bacterium]|jgi:hypothetical protein
MGEPRLNPLALTRYRDRKAEIKRRVVAGELTREQGAAQLRVFAAVLLRRRPKSPPIGKT